MIYDNEQSSPTYRVNLGAAMSVGFMTLAAFFAGLWNETGGSLALGVAVWFGCMGHIFTVRLRHDLWMRDKEKDVA